MADYDFSDSARKKLNYGKQTLKENIGKDLSLKKTFLFKFHILS